LTQRIARKEKTDTTHGKVQTMMDASFIVAIDTNTDELRKQYENEAYAEFNRKNRRMLDIERKRAERERQDMLDIERMDAEMY
jgi:hypothetical protein